MHFLAGTPSIELHGFRGSEKSHILAAIAVTLFSIRATAVVGNAGVAAALPESNYFPRCVFLPKMDNISFLADITFAIAFAFPENTTVTRMNYDQLFQFIKEQPPCTIYCILDDYNKLNTLSQEYKFLIAFLEINQYCLRGISANEPIRDRFALFLQGTLTDEEWNAWRTFPKYTRLAQVIGNENEGEFHFLSGNLPLIIDLMSFFLTTEYPETNPIANPVFSDIVDLYLASLLDGGGRWMKNQLTVWSEKLDKHPSTIRKWMELMAAAMIGCRCDVPASSHYPNQFFLWDGRTSMLKPVCGFVSVLMKSVMASADYSLFQSVLKLGWAEAALKSENPCIRRFAFEAYCLTHINTIVLDSIDPNLQAMVQKAALTTTSFQEMKICTFHGDVPTAIELERGSKAAITLFIPRKWNLRYVDAVLKIVHATVKNKKKTTYLLPIHITPQSPSDQADSLSFYGTGAATNDFHHYMEDDDFNLEGWALDWKYKFLWVTPANIHVALPAPLPQFDNHGKRKTVTQCHARIA